MKFVKMFSCILFVCLATRSDSQCDPESIVRVSLINKRIWFFLDPIGVKQLSLPGADKMDLSQMDLSKVIDVLPAWESEGTILMFQEGKCCQFYVADSKEIKRMKTYDVELAFSEFPIRLFIHKNTGCLLTSQRIIKLKNRRTFCEELYYCPWVAVPPQKGVSTNQNPFKLAAQEHVFTISRYNLINHIVVGDDLIVLFYFDEFGGGFVDISLVSVVSETYYFDAYPVSDMIPISADRQEYLISHGFFQGQDFSGGTIFFGEKQNEKFVLNQDNKSLDVKKMSKDEYKEGCPIYGLIKAGDTIKAVTFDGKWFPLQGDTKISLKEPTFQKSNIADYYQATEDSVILRINPDIAAYSRIIVAHEEKISK